MPRGGKREGAGRPKEIQDGTERSFLISKEHLKFLQELRDEVAPTCSHVMRKVLDWAMLVYKPGKG